MTVSTNTIQPTIEPSAQGGHVRVGSHAISDLLATKSDIAYRLLRAQILSGEISPGSVINQEAVATKLGISVTPLREALRGLRSEGLVELGAHKDARVSPLTAAEARELLEMRQALEPYAAQLASNRRGNADVEALNEAAKLLHPLSDGAGEGAVLAHRDFHAAIYRASGNTMLIDSLEGLWDKSDRYRRLGLTLIAGSGRTRVKDYNEHFVILAAVLDGRSEEAAELMRQHIEHSLGELATHELDS